MPAGDTRANKSQVERDPEKAMEKAADCVHNCAVGVAVEAAGSGSRYGHRCSRGNVTEGASQPRRMRSWTPIKTGKHAPPRHRRWSLKAASHALQALERRANADRPSPGLLSLAPPTPSAKKKEKCAQPLLCVGSGKSAVSRLQKYLLAEQTQRQM